MKQVWITTMVWLAAISCQAQAVYEIYEDTGNVTYVNDDPLTSPTLHPNRANIVILADGYDGTVNIGDYDRFIAHKDAFMDQLFGADNSGEPYSSPYREYRDWFNVYWVWVASASINGLGTGCRYDLGDTLTGDCYHVETCAYGACFDTIANHFGSRYDALGLHRYMLPAEPESLISMIQSMFSNQSIEFTVVSLANTVNNITVHPSYPGLDFRRAGGGAIQHVVPGIGACVSGRGTEDSTYINPNTMEPFVNLSTVGETAVHEFNHAFANLLDEYWYDVDSLGLSNEWYNRTINGNTSDPNHPWAHWLDSVPATSAIGAFPVPATDFCSYTIPDSLTNWYRPVAHIANQFETHCKMGPTGTSFCAVCKEAIIEKLHALVNLIDGFSPVNPLNLNDTMPEVYATEGLTFTLELVEPTHGDLEVIWQIGDDTVFIDSEAPWEFEFDCILLDALPADTFLVKATVKDNANGMVRSHLHPNPPYFDHNDHYSEQYWKLIWEGNAQTDLWMKDYPEDIGDEPWSPFGWFFDHSPDMKVQNTQEQGSYTWDDLAHENPHYHPDSSAFVYAQVRNRGCATSDGDDTLRVYTTYRGSGDSWEAGYWGYPTPSQFGYEVGYGLIPSIARGDSAIVEIEWDWGMDTIHPDTVNNWYSCLLARIENVALDPIDTPDTLNITNWIHYNNNISMFNAHVLDLNFTDGLVQSIAGKPIVGGWVYVDNNGDGTDDFDLEFDTDSKGKETDIRDEAEIIVSFGSGSAGFDVVDALDNATLSGLVQLDSVTFRVTADNAAISDFEIPQDAYVPTFVGFAFLTEEVSATEEYLYHMSQYRSSAPDVNLAGQHYEILRASRSLFTADAGDDETILSGDTITLTADDIGEDALYFWLNGAGEVVGTGNELDVSPSVTTTYTLEVIAEEDGYKDYDDVTITVTNGLITSVAPNPASSTTTVYYETSGVTTVKLKVVEVGSMMQVDNFTVTAGTGSKVITVSGYNTGAHIITLEGDSEDLDSETLMVQ